MLPLLLATLGAVLAGAMSGLFGFGGAAFLSPWLVLALGLSQHEAQALSLAALLPPVGWPALRAYAKSGVTTPWRFAGALITGFLFGAGLGGLLAQALSGRALRLVFSAFLVLLAARALRQARGPGGTVDAPSGPDTFAPVAVGIGALAGLASGLLGIGGGVIVTPLAQRYGSLSRLQSQAASLAMMLPPIGLPAVFAYAVGQGGLPWAMLIAVGLGFATGSALGGRWAAGLSPRTAALSSGGLAAVLAVLLVLKA